MNNKKLNFLLTGLLAIALVTSSFLIYEVNALRNTINGINSINVEIGELHSKLVYLSEYEKKHDEMLNMLDKYKTALPDSAKESSIITSVNKLAVDNTIKLNGVTFQDRKKDGKLVKIPLSISLTGNYFDIVNFIIDIRNNDRIINISSIVVQRENQNSQGVTAYITLNAYIVS